MIDTSLLQRASSGDREACGTLLEENQRLIWSIVRRFSGRGVENEDLYQLGCIGFLKAVEGFDPGYGTCFSTYAVPKIAGEIRRFLRDHGAVKVSRGQQEQNLQVYRARLALTEELGREPVILEVAERCGLTPEEVSMAEGITAGVMSLQWENEEGSSLENLLAGEDEEEKTLERLMLQEVIEMLPQREQMVLKLRYFRDMTQQQTARIVGVSQVQVSRLEKKAISAIRQLLSAEE